MQIDHETGECYGSTVADAASIIVLAAPNRGRWTSLLDGTELEELSWNTLIP